MLMLLLNTALSLFMGSVGLAAGWYLHASRSGRRVVETPVDKEQSERSERDAQQRRREAIELIERVKTLAQGIATDVEQHNESVQYANSELVALGFESDDVMVILTRVIEANRVLNRKLEIAEDRLFEQATMIQNVAQEANTDAMTGISNRRCFDKAMSEAKAKFDREGTPVTVMMVDVDHFKRFNDTHGHVAGDCVLRYVARTLARKTRKRGLACRYGGEEFGVIFPGETLEQCMEWAETTRAAISSGEVEFQGQVFRVTASAGLAQIQMSESYETLVTRADDALYQAKQAGRDRCYRHDGNLIHPVTPSHDSDSRGEPSETNSESEAFSGLSSAIAFKDDIRRRVAEWKRGGPTVSLVVIKIDDWMEILTSRGPETAELVMRATVQFLKASVRDMDNIAVLGEGRFAALFPSARLENTQKIAERLRSAISRCEVNAAQGRVQFSVSIGITELIIGDTAELFIERADLAAAEAASQGGNICLLHDGDHTYCVTRR